MKNVRFVLVVCLLAPSIASGDATRGTVQVPLEAYQHLVSSTQQEESPAKLGEPGVSSSA